MTLPDERPVFLVTGIPGAGKSAVARALAERIPRSVHLRGDMFRRSIVNGRFDMSPDAGESALGQVRMRYRLAAAAADEYIASGFTVVYQDVVLGDHLTLLTRLIRTRPFYVVVLAPAAEVVAARLATRIATRLRLHAVVTDDAALAAVGDRSQEDYVFQLDHQLRVDTPKVGLWIDTSVQSTEDTVTEILARAEEEGAV
jgi:predicted kinase